MEEKIDRARRSPPLAGCGADAFETVLHGNGNLATRGRGLRRRAETTDRQEAMSEARAGCLARDPRRRLAHILTVAWATRELRPDEDLARDKILVWAAWRRDG